MKDVSIHYGPSSDRTQVLKDVNLSIEKNEFIAIVGFSGSGKSTLINLLSGLQKPSEGQVLMGGKLIEKADPERGVVFQNYSLLPWLTVFDNIDLAAKQVFPEMGKMERKQHVDRYIEMVSLTPASAKKPAELSGGMRQRVSLARTLSMQPKVLLMDEPFSALDALTRANLQDEITQIWEDDKRTVVFITNDVDEAVLMADKVVALTPGPSATLARAFDVSLERPRNRKSIIHDKDFLDLRNSINKYLLKLKQKSDELSGAQQYASSSLEPIDLRKTNK